MRRTNIYLEEQQLDLLRGLADRRGKPVAELVREAVDSWLDSQDARRVSPDEWEERFDALLARRARIAKERGFQPAEVERDVMDAVREVRRARAARRR
jgi:predicted DNA-binding protein